MRMVVQRVSRASVTVEERIVGQINQGLLVYVGIASDDGEADANYLANKVSRLRIFDDAAGKMNLSVEDVGGSCLIISAFSIQGDARKGNRPTYVTAAATDGARKLYDYLCTRFRNSGLQTETGIFQAGMSVESVNDGPICILLDSTKKF